MSLFAFEPSGTGSRRTVQGAPEPGREDGGPVAEREWGLSAGQVAAVVAAIVAACEVVGMLF